MAEIEERLELDGKSVDALRSEIEQTSLDCDNYGHCRDMIAAVVAEKWILQVYDYGRLVQPIGANAR